MPTITSRHHPIVQDFRELARGGGPRLLLDGWHLVGEATRAGVRLETVAICGIPAPPHQDILRRATETGTRIIEVSTAVMNALSPVKSPTGIVASAHRPSIDVQALLQPSPALLLAAVGLQDPGNVGALIRSAAAAGATGVMLDHASADPWSWKALRAAMGSTFHVPVIRHPSLVASMGTWRSAGLSILAAVPRGGTSMYDVEFTRPTAILLGGEGPGLPEDLAALADARVSIPMHGAAESLNVAVAAALLLYEARRQRQPSAVASGIDRP